MSRSSPLSPRRSIPPPTVFYYQTTTVPLSPLARPQRARCTPLPLNDGAHFSTPSLSDFHIENTAEDARAIPRGRHEGRINEIADFNDEISLERIKSIEREVGNLVNGRIAMDEVFNLVCTQLQGALDAITGLEGRMEDGRQETRDLRDIASIMQDVNERQADELVAAHTQILTLERRLEESQVRERDRDQRMEELTEIVRSLQATRRLLMYHL